MITIHEICQHIPDGVVVNLPFFMRFLVVTRFLHSVVSESVPLGKHG